MSIRIPQAKNLVILTLASFLILPLKAQALVEDLPQVTVSAQFDLSTHRVTGRVTILIPPHARVQITAAPCVTFRPSPQGSSYDFTTTFQAPSPKGYIGAEGIVLTGAWFPQPVGLSRYRVSISLPKGLIPIAPMDKLEARPIKGQVSYTFFFPYPCKGMPLVAAPYHVFRARAHGTTLAVYLLKRDEHLAHRYLLAMAQYLKEYSHLIGTYPYRRMAVVVNPFGETGYAFPTFTLLGSHVIRLPFILRSSLPHEILHNWFGNGVYVKGGNWCEGLVSYLADQRMAEEEGEGWRYRHRILLNYQAYVTPEREFPLIRFRERYSRASQAIGYGKGTMVFHMLRRRIGDKPFFRALSNLYKEFLFREAGWEDIERLMEEASGEDLTGFFRPWLNKEGIPQLKAKIHIINRGKGDHLVHINLREKGPLFPLQVPVVIEGERWRKKVILNLDGETTEAEVEVAGEPKQVLIDPNYDLLRRLTPPEYPPVVARVLGERGYMVGGNSPAYYPLKGFLREKGYREVETALITPQEIKENVIYLGKLPSNLSLLFHSPPKQSCLYLEVQENPFHRGATITWLLSTSQKEAQQFLPKLPHLGAYQILAVSQGKLVKMEEPHFQRGIKTFMGNEAMGVDLHRLLSLPQVAQGVSSSRVIFLGEDHREYGHHMAQLGIIRWLVEHGHDIAIGMEMFPRTSQKVIDRYLKGELTTAQFLKGTGYFSQWGYDYKLYKPIIDYAKKHQLPIVAINLPKGLVQKVARGGLKALSPKERREIPQHLDLSNKSYRQYLKEAYKLHRKNTREIRDFETFCESQVLWDESMASSIAEYLTKHPEKQMVVIVGKGHVVYGYGIPSRIKRRGIGPSSTVILGSDQELAPDMGDYLLIPPRKRPPFSAKIGVLVREKRKGLLIVSVLPHSPAQRGGLKEGDVIVAADGHPIKGIADLRVLLLGKTPGDTLQITILRGKRRLNPTIGPFATPP